MALLVTRPVVEALLNVDAKEHAFANNHIFEPEFHQERYVGACVASAKAAGAFQIGKAPKLVFGPCRGVQPIYADDEQDPGSLEYEGMVLGDGTKLGDAGGMANVCALKSACIRRGYIDFGLARCVSREFWKKSQKANVRKGDVLINSTGDGTIGRAAVYDEDFPAVVDGHITILRFSDPEQAWYIAAFILSDAGQLQLYRYINGSSGQVELYPQDIGRVWVKPAPSHEIMKRVAKGLQSATNLHRQFYEALRTALVAIDAPAADSMDRTLS